MSIIERSQSYIFSSSTTNDAVAIGALGNKFQIQLLDPISIPRDAIYATAEITQAQIWNTSPNVAVLFTNNHFYINDGVSGLLDITIPDGLYGLTELEATLQREFVNLGLAQDLISLSGNSATNTVVITFNYIGTTVDFTPVNSVREVLGFASVTLLSTFIGESITGANVAEFNRVNSYLIKSNLLGSGIPLNKIGSGILSNIQIDVPPGSQITAQPQHPIKSVADELIGMSKQNLIFTLLDQLQRDVSTAGETWSFTLVLKYYQWASSQKSNTFIPGIRN